MMIKKNISLIIAISIPILMIIFVALSIYLPSFFVTPPKYSFLYTTSSDNYNNLDQYSVKDGKLIKTEFKQIENAPQEVKPITIIPTGEIKFFIYDMATNTSREVSFDEASKLNLDSSIKSPDGFEVVSGGSGDGIPPLFFGPGNDNSSQYIKGHGLSKKLNTTLIGRYYYGFRFLGWIKQ